MTASDKGSGLKGPGFWRDFAHTLTVDMASALADHEQSAGRLPRQRREVMSVLYLHAAAGGGGFNLPEGEQLTSDGQIGIRFEPADSGIRIHLQLQGFAAIADFGDCPARVSSGNGAVAIEVRFDRDGAASCLVADEPRVREGLREMQIRILLEP